MNIRSSMALINVFLRRLPPTKAARARLRLRRLVRPACLGTLRRTSPLSDDFGYDRGTPVDRYYIDRFLSEHGSYIRGRVLEVKDSGYTQRFGTGVSQSDVLDVDASNPSATIVADLVDADAIPDENFDCFILTQTLQYVYDVSSAIRHAHRILKTGGILLATVPGTSPVIVSGGVTDYWRFTPASCALIFGDVFGVAAVTVRGHGNVLTSIAFLAGMAREELSTQELDSRDERYPMLISVSAIKR